ncbi:hypothetical protein ECC02_012675 [Trypanosoma cruzi]|uniref:Secreted protein n=1 Tax=Trypanosoma cruzi TaxID=5693 RepID=A0A7J6XL65_TRYCR|nr:hypothetical protein ECC02_012675 [Trypanosoma cruzi]
MFDSVGHFWAFVFGAAAWGWCTRTVCTQKSIQKYITPTIFLYHKSKLPLSSPNSFSYFVFPHLRRASSLQKFPDDTAAMYWRTSSSQNAAISRFSARLTLSESTTSHLCQSFIGVLSACCTLIISHDMSRDNSSQPLKYAARHSVNCLTVLVVVRCSPAVVIRSPTSVIGFESTKKKPSTSGKCWTSGSYSTQWSIATGLERRSGGGRTSFLVKLVSECSFSAQLCGSRRPGGLSSLILTLIARSNSSFKNADTAYFSIRYGGT